MKFVTAVFLTGFLAYVIGSFTHLPWWSFVFASFIVAIAVHQKAGKAFLAGFTGLFLLWGLLALLKDTANEHVLSTKVAKLFYLGDSYILLIFVTAFLGGLISGLAAVSGSNLRKSKSE